MENGLEWNPGRQFLPVFTVKPGVRLLWPGAGEALFETGFYIAIYPRFLMLKAGVGQFMYIQIALDSNSYVKV